MPRPNPATWVFVALAGALFLISRTSGAGWILVILSVLVGLVIVNAAWAWLSLRTAAVTASGPRDGVVGDPLELNVTTSGIASIVRLEFDELAVETVAMEVPGHGAVQVTPLRRGVLVTISAVAVCDAPFGLAKAKRRLSIPLASPIEIAPRPLSHPLPASLATSHDGDGAPQHRVGDGDVVRSLREYSMGDAPRLIHWAASARAGDLRVKELEPPDHPWLELVVDVSATSGETAASHAAGLIRAGLNAGHPILLHTYDSHGPLSGPVGSALEAGRRLARAVPGVPPQAISDHAVTLR